MRTTELVVFSHLPWDFVWQRPQHLISRLARGRRTWFVEECRVRPDIPRPRVRRATAGPVERVWLEVPGPERIATFADPVSAEYPDAVAALLGPRPDRVIWTYSPLALPYIERLDRKLLVYDVMDDLAAFADASPRMRAEQDALLAVADVVFAGGRTIRAGVAGRSPVEVHLFASGVEPEHYAAARRARRRRERPVAGYVGVIDERIDLGIVRGIAERLPGWDVQMVGPVFKIDPAALPQAPNLHYPGIQPYERLPEVMAGFDVALMPFALNEATRSISPTKTLEYLAAGLPVVSTRVADVVADYRGVVDLQDDAAGFSAACEAVLRQSGDVREHRVQPLLQLHHWDTIAARMGALVDAAIGETEGAAGAAAEEAS